MDPTCDSAIAGTGAEVHPYTVTIVPQITKVEPAVSGNNGGNPVTITGTGFATFDPVAEQNGQTGTGDDPSAVVVVLAGADCTVSSRTDTRIVCTPGPKPGGSAPSNKPRQRRAAADCTDTSGSCPAWASAGECANNPGYMLTECRLSCNACPTAPPAAGAAAGTGTTGTAGTAEAGPFVKGVGAVKQRWVGNAGRQFTGNWGAAPDTTEEQIGPLFGTRREYCKAGLHENKKFVPEEGVYGTWRDVVRTGSRCCHKDCLICSAGSYRMYDKLNYRDTGTSVAVPAEWHDDVGTSTSRNCEDRSMLSGQQCCIDEFTRFCVNATDINCKIPREATQVDGLFIPPRSAKYSFWAHGGGKVEVFVAKPSDLPVAANGVLADVSTTAPVAVSPESTSQYYLHASQRSAPIYMEQGDPHYLRVRQDLPYDVSRPAEHVQVALRTFDPPAATYDLNIAAPGQYHAVPERVNISTHMPSGSLSGGRRSLYLSGVTADTAITWKVTDKDAKRKGTGGVWKACDADSVCSTDWTTVADLVAAQQEGRPSYRLQVWDDVYDCWGCWKNSLIECHDDNVNWSPHGGTRLLQDGPAEVVVEHSYTGRATDGRTGWLRITWNYKCIGERFPSQIEVHEVGCKDRGEDDTPFNGCSSDGERLGQKFGEPVASVYRRGSFRVNVGPETTGYIAHSANAKEMKEALEALPNVQEVRIVHYEGVLTVGKLWQVEFLKQGGHHYAISASGIGDDGEQPSAQHVPTRCARAHTRAGMRP